MARISTLIQMLVNKYQVIDKLADSRAIRRAAQLTAYGFFKSKALGEQAMKQVKNSDAAHQMKQGSNMAGERVQSFSENLKRELKKGFEDMKNK